MDEYIGKQRLISILEARADMANADFKPVFLSVAKMVQLLPAADVEPVRHGEWLLKHIGHGHYWECSECHTNPCIYVTENTRFCPNCGAKMDGGVDNV